MTLCDWSHQPNFSLSRVAPVRIAPHNVAANCVLQRLTNGKEPVTLSSILCHHTYQRLFADAVSDGATQILFGARTPDPTCSGWLQACTAGLTQGLMWALLIGVFGATTAQAAGTSAGAAVPNAVSLDYTLRGVDLRAGSVTTFWVDELLDVSLVSADASSIGVLPGQSAAVQQYTLTNLGNGVEAFRLNAEPIIPGDNFDATLDAIFLETNGTAGLQIGPGGDDVYVAGTNDPQLPADATQTVYVTADIPAGVVISEVALLELRAIATTIVAGSGTDDPALPAFPPVGTSYADLGDAASDGAGDVAAVVGVSYDPANPLYLDRHDFLVTDAGVTIIKTAFTVLDPIGGSTVVPGSVINYRVLVELAGGASAQTLTVSDPVPGELLYTPNSISVVGLPTGEEADDDFIPAGVDNTGINGDIVEITFGDVVGPQSLTIEYQAIVQ